MSHQLDPTFLKNTYTQNQYIPYLGCPVTLFIMMTLSAISPNLLKYARSVSEKKKNKKKKHANYLLIVILCLG